MPLSLPYGIPSGRIIPNNQLSISVNLIDLQMTAQESLDAPRVHNFQREVNKHPQSESYEPLPN